MIICDPIDKSYKLTSKKLVDLIRDNKQFWIWIPRATDNINIYFLI